MLFDKGTLVVIGRGPPLDCVISWLEGMDEMAGTGRVSWRQVLAATGFPQRH